MGQVQTGLPLADGRKEDAPAIDRGAEGEHHNSDAEGAARKAFVTLQAQFALSGYQLHRLVDNTLLMSRWGLSREFVDVCAAENFLHRLGCRA